jgi:hypothetical protein
LFIDCARGEFSVTDEYDQSMAMRLSGIAIAANAQSVSVAGQSITCSLKLQSVDIPEGERHVGGYGAHDCEALPWDASRLIAMVVICVFPSMTWMSSESYHATSMNKQFVIVKSSRDPHGLHRVRL